MYCLRAHIAAALMNYSRNQQTAPTTPTEPTPAPSEGNKVLIAYFSATNNTENIANHLDAILDADLYEITPERRSDQDGPPRTAHRKRRPRR